MTDIDTLVVMLESVKDDPCAWSPYALREVVRIAIDALTAERVKITSLQAAALDLLDALTTERAKVAALEAEVKIAEAKGWRDAVSCVQYCAANWSQDCRSEAERNALEDAARKLVNELVTCSPGEWLGTEWKTAQDYSDIIAKLEAEVARFKQESGQ